MWYLYFRRFALAVFAAFVGLVLLLFLLVLNTFPVQANAKKEALQFPFFVEGTELIAEHFVSYEGDYFEDQSGEFVIDGAALCVYNKADTHIAFASIHIETFDGVYCFEGTCIPPHTKVVMLEKYKAPYPQTSVYFAVGKTVAESSESVMGDLLISAVDMGRIEVKNISDRALDDVYLYYKRYDSQWDICIGGITYAVSAGSLQAGESAILFPEKYAKGYTKVLYAAEN